MIKLNLPEFAHKIQIKNDKPIIFDIIRKKYIVLTPEEWVRQHFVNYLISCYKFPKGLIKIESGLSYNHLSKRTDIVLFNRNGLPFAIVECKAASVKISQQVLDQAACYNNSLKAKYVIVTNGLIHICASVSHENGQIVFLDGLPDLNELI